MIGLHRPALGVIHNQRFKRQIEEDRGHLRLTGNSVLPQLLSHSNVLILSQRYLYVKRLRSHICLYIWAIPPGARKHTEN